MPPLAVFLGKWLILLSGVGKEYYMACIVAVLGSVVETYLFNAHAHMVAIRA